MPKVKLKLRKNQCKSCPFLRENHEMLSVKRWASIYGYLLEGVQHVCHTTDKHVCRGARNWQLAVWASKGIIKAPTDEALHERMETVGVEPMITECDEI